MKLLLLQDKPYLPSLGGGHKANRLLMEALATRGNYCTVVAPALTTRAGPTTRAEFLTQMAARDVQMKTLQPGLYRFQNRGVRVFANDFPTIRETSDHINRVIEQKQPDFILVSDDKNRILLECGIRARPTTVILLLQTIVHLPFGPLSHQTSARQVQLMREARGIVVISLYLKEYLEAHGDLNSKVIRLPVYGEQPFPVLGSFSRGCVTMVNPCIEKGLTIFLALAEQFSDVQFAAVPTWGADSSVMQQLSAYPNVRILTPADEIGEILKHTRILVAPSLWPETFGYIVPEAMLRGIPVMASDNGGLREAKLGVDYLLPVTPATPSNGAYVSPPQNIGPWSRALRELLADREVYERCSRASRKAALNFVSEARVENFESYLSALTRQG